MKDCVVGHVSGNPLMSIWVSKKEEDIAKAENTYYQYEGSFLLEYGHDCCVMLWLPPVRVSLSSSLVDVEDVKDFPIIKGFVLESWPLLRYLWC